MDGKNNNLLNNSDNKEKDSQSTNMKNHQSKNSKKESNRGLQGGNKVSHSHTQNPNIGINKQPPSSNPNPGSQQVSGNPLPPRRPSQIVRNFLSQKNQSNRGNQGTTSFKSRIGSLLGKNRTSFSKTTSNVTEESNPPEGNLGNQDNMKSTTPEKRETSSHTPLELWGTIPTKVKIAIAAGGVIFFLIMIIIIIIVSNSTAHDDRTVQQGFISGNLSESDLCKNLIKNSYVKNEEECKKSGAYKFYTKIKSVIQDKQSDYGVSLIPGLIYETISYNRADDETYNEFTDAEIENLADALVEEVKETCYTYTNVTEDNKAYCKKERVEWTYHQISFDKYISYLKFGNSSTHPNYQHKPRTISNDTCQGPVDDSLCGKQQGSDSGSKKRISSNTTSGGCPSVSSPKTYPAAACAGQSGSSNSDSGTSNSAISLDGKDLTVYNQDKYNDLMCTSGCQSKISNSGCSASAYSAAVYLLTGNKVSLPKVANVFCSNGVYLCGQGGVGDKIATNSTLQSIYGIGGTRVPKTYDSFVQQLKDNKVVVVSITNGSQNDRNGSTGFNATSNGHFILLGKYNASNGQIFVYNPNGNRNGGYRTKEDIIKYVEKVNGVGAWAFKKL